MEVSLEVSCLSTLGNGQSRLQPMNASLKKRQKDDDDREIRSKFLERTKSTGEQNLTFGIKKEIVY